MPFIVLTREQFIDGSIRDPLLRVAVLKSDDFEKSNEYVEFGRSFLNQAKIFKSFLFIQLQAHNATIDDNSETLSWTFAVAQDGTDFNLQFDVWKAVTSNVFGRDGFKISDFTLETNNDPALAQDVIDLADIVVITDNP